MIISFNGQAGAGKSTVSDILATKLNMTRHYMGGIMRLIAEKKGASIDELQALAAEDPAIDKEVDSYIIELGAKEDDFIIVSRVAWHLLPNSFKIYLTVDPHEGARRIAGKENSAYTSQEEAFEKLITRTKAEQDRFRKKYNVEIDKQENFDLVLDTSDKTPQQVAELVEISLPQGNTQAEEAQDIRELL